MHRHIEQTLAVGRGLDRHLYLALVIMAHRLRIHRHAIPERIIERAVKAAKMTPAAPRRTVERMHVPKARAAVKMRVHRLEHAHRHIGRRKTHGHRQRGRRTGAGLTKAQPPQFPAHHVVIAAQFERVILGRRRLEHIALVRQVRRPLVECGDIATNRRGASRQQEGRCYGDKSEQALHVVLHPKIDLPKSQFRFLIQVFLSNFTDCYPVHMVETPCAVACVWRYW